MKVGSIPNMYHENKNKQYYVQFNDYHEKNGISQ